MAERWMGWQEWERICSGSDVRHVSIKQLLEDMSPREVPPRTKSLGRPRQLVRADGRAGPVQEEEEPDVTEAEKVAKA